MDKKMELRETTVQEVAKLGLHSAANMGPHKHSNFMDKISPCKIKPEDTTESSSNSQPESDSKTNTSTAQKTAKVRKKREKYIPDDLIPLELPPCRICGKKASGIHYGVNSCEACKGFFRRYMQRKVPYYCHKGGKCDIYNYNGLLCSGCRMERCLQLGMSKEGIRQGRYTSTERMKTIEELRKLKTSTTGQSESPKCLQSVTESESQPNISVTLSEVNPEPCLKRRVSNDFPVSNKSLNLLPINTHSVSPDSNESVSSHSSTSPRSFSFLAVDRPSDSCQKCSSSDQDSNSSFKSDFRNNLNIKHSHNALEIKSQNSKLDTSRKSISMTDETLFSEEKVVKMTSVLESLEKGYQEMKPYTKNMSDEQIQELMQTGYLQYKQQTELFGNMDPVPADLFNEVFKATSIDVDGRTKIFDLIKKELVTIIHEYVRFTHGIPQFNKLPPKDQASLLKAARLEFFLLFGYRDLSPETGMMISWTGHVLPIRHFAAYAPEEMSTSWLEINTKVRNLKLTTHEHIVMLALCLTFTDRCALENREAVEKIQSELMEVLLYLLDQRYSTESSRQLCKIMNIFLELRGLNEKFLAIYKKICEDKFIIEHLPELLQFLFDE